MDTNNNQKARMKRNNIIVIVLSVILIVVVALFFFQKSEHRGIVSELRNEKNSIQIELNQIVAKYDSLRTENDTINEQLMLAQAKVKDILLEVEQVKRVSYQTITNYQNQVNTQLALLRDLYIRVDSLNTANERLLNENREVREQVRRVETENTQQRQVIERQNQQIQRAQMLEAREIIAEGLNSRDRPVAVAGRTEKIRVSFVISSNVVAPRGAKNIYIRIMRPDQLLLTKSASNLFRFDNSPIQYSAVREVNYEGLDLPVAIYWDNANEPAFMPGIYIINIFADGHMIGETKLELRLR